MTNKGRQSKEVNALMGFSPSLSLSVSPSLLLHLSLDTLTYFNVSRLYGGGTTVVATEH